MGVDNTGGSDTRTETTDKPTPQERPSGPPPDNPGSPGQPSRLESLARARQEQQERRSQEPQDKDAGGPPREERDDKPASEQVGSDNEETEASGKPAAEDQGRREDYDRAGTNQPGRRGRREQEPSAQDEDSKPGSGTPGDRERPQSQTAEQRPDIRTEPADRPASPERRWTPPPDNPGSPGQPSRLESLARAREQQESRRQQPEGAATAQETGRPGTDESRAEDDPKPDDGLETRPEPAAQTTDRPTGPQGPRPGTTTGEPGSQERTADQPASDNTLPSSEEPVRNRETAESVGQHDGDHGKKTEELETTELGSENNAPDRDPHSSGETGTELARQEANTTEMEKLRRFDGRIQMAFESDGRPIPPNRDTGNDTADREPFSAAVPGRLITA